MMFCLFSFKNKKQFKCNPSSHLKCHLFCFYLVEHVSEIILWIYPGGHCIAEEYKVLSQRRQVRQHFNFQHLHQQQQQHSDHHLVAASHLHDTSGVHTDHSANSSERRVFLLIVSYVS